MDGPQIYAIAEPFQDNGLRWVKIGTAVRPERVKKRMQEHQCGNPRKLELLASAWSRQSAGVNLWQMWKEVEDPIHVRLTEETLRSTASKDNEWFLVEEQQDWQAWLEGLIAQVWDESNQTIRS